MKYIISLLFILSFYTAHAQEETIYVELESESPLLPLYLSSISVEGGGFDEPYLQKLKQVLSFDLEFNGATYLVKESKLKENILKKSPFEKMGELADLQKIEAYFIAKIRVKDKKLGCRLITVSNGSMKQIDGLELTGNLNHDRRQCHILADSIHQQLFGEPGIASTHILYSVRYKSEGTNHFSEIFESDWDGSNARAVTADAGYAITPFYVPPKKGFQVGSFFYVSYKNGQPKIFYSSLKKFEPVRFSTLKGNQLMPTLSRQRDKVAFISDITGNPDLFMQPIEVDGTPTGKPSQIFSTYKATQGTPTFSPDGDKIAFVSNKDGAPRVYMMNVPAPGASIKTLKAELITRYNKESTAPAWSPDGKKIAYTSMTDGTRQIWVYDLEKRRERQLTKGPGHKENPSWAPNSLHIVFNSNEKGTSELFLINLNQPEARKISSGVGEKRFPCWEPRA